MAVEVWKLHLDGYLVRDPNNMDDPNNIDFDVVIAEVLRNPFECSITKIDSIEGDGDGESA